MLDLGEQPLANELVLAPDAPDDAFPLHLRSCRTCGLGQVGEFVLPERIFSDYPYLSSVSTSWLAHARTYAESRLTDLGLTPDDLVVEVASNDGYLLQNFRAAGIPVLGIEPAANVAAVASASGVDTLVKFFGRQTAQQVLADHGHPRLVVANNVMAHVPDLDDFIGGLAVLCGPRTVITVENPSYATLLQQTQFDTIYHEHYSYLSAHAVAIAAAQHGLELIRVEELPTHGGSYRYWIVRHGARKVEASVSRAIKAELTAGLLDEDVWKAFAERSRATLSDLRRWLDERQSTGRRVAAYGAAAKGNTLLNAARVTAQDIVAVADGSREKQGKLLPGSRIPIVAPSELPSTKPDDVLILPWNLAGEIASLVDQLVPGGRSWTAVPAMRELRA